MSRYLITTLLAAILFVPAQDNFTLTEIIRDYNPRTKETTIRLPSSKLSGPKDPYHSLSYSISYITAAKDVNFELVSVVKAQKLNSDLYVVFLVDDKEIHFSSDRSAIPKPVRGKPWIGERMVFKIPGEEFMKLAEAEKLGVKLGGVSFEFNEATRLAIRAFATNMKY